MAGNTPKRTVKSSQLPYNVAYHLKLTGTPYQNDGQFGVWWKWPIEVPADNPDKQSQYASEWAYLSVGTPDLQGKLEAAYQQLGQPAGNRTVADITVTRVQVGRGSDYVVQPYGLGAGVQPPQPAAVPQQMAPQGVQPIQPGTVQPAQPAPKPSPVRHALGVTVLTYLVKKTYAEASGAELGDEAAQAIAVHAGIFAEKQGADLLAMVNAHLKESVIEADTPLDRFLREGGFEADDKAEEVGAAEGDEVPF